MDYRYLSRLEDSFRINRSRRKELFKMAEKAEGAYIISGEVASKKNDTEPLICWLQGSRFDAGFLVQDIPAADGRQEQLVKIDIPERDIDNLIRAIGGYTADEFNDKGAD